jgi:hypothetical protein
MTMSSDPPEGSPPLAPNRDKYQPPQRWGGLSNGARIGLVVGLVVVVAVAVALLAEREDPQPALPVETTSPSPTSNLACAQLLEAEAALDAGDDVSFRAAIREAGRVARRTLDTSGEAFGAPERVAIELELSLQGDPEPESLRGTLERGLTACGGT